MRKDIDAFRGEIETVKTLLEKMQETSLKSNQDYFEKKDELTEQIEELDNILKDLSYMDTNYESHKTS